MSLYERASLTDTIFLGNSYGGTVIGGVADSIPTKVSALIQLDAVVPVSEKSVLDFQFDERRKFILA